MTGRIWSRPTYESETRWSSYSWSPPSSGATNASDARVGPRPTWTRLSARSSSSTPRMSHQPPRFPKPKLGGWWLVLGADDELLALKRVHVGRAPTRASLQFIAPDDGGAHEYELHLVSDSYVGLDQLHAVTVRVAEACD